MHYRCLCAIACACACAAALRGQSVPGGAGNVSGEVTWEGEGRVDSLSVELITAGRVIDRVSVAPDGSVELRGVASGECELRVAGPDESIIQRQFVSVHGHVQGVVFRLAGTQRAPGARRCPQGVFARRASRGKGNARRVDSALA